MINAEYGDSNFDMNMTTLAAGNPREALATPDAITTHKGDLAKMVMNCLESVSPNL